ncbi:nucleotidyltransferase family protein [Nocardioides limicola]|uniref:nucleotidyltransferase family protein n=1 Tax=Nocardioides limicola TaxID=2803368 RepID=UPI001EF14C37|nr:nucleotidyltransferase domain-containing protein [Nocardioides sp. DJM-14]
MIREAGGTNVRVFGSVAREADGDGSDIDLLFTMERPMSLFEIGRLEQRLADLIGVPVDLVPESALRPDLADQVTREAVPI